MALKQRSRVLIAEDDRALGALLQRAFQADGHEVDLLADGEAVSAAMQTCAQGSLPPDLVILDLGLPKVDGATVLETLRSMHASLPVLVLTAQTGLEVRLRCFDLGADDCMLKPFSLRELRARCSALLRRGSVMASPVLRFGELEIDRMERSVRMSGVNVSLTNKEYGLLECLMLNQGRCVSRNLLMEQVWKLGTESSTNIVDVYINYLRRKLGENTGSPLIATVRGEGYRIGTPAYLPA